MRFASEFRILRIARRRRRSRAGTLRVSLATRRRGFRRASKAGLAAARRARAVRRRSARRWRARWLLGDRSASPASPRPSRPHAQFEPVVAGVRGRASAGGIGEHALCASGALCAPERRRRPTSARATTRGCFEANEYYLGSLATPSRSLAQFEPDPARRVELIVAGDAAKLRDERATSSPRLTQFAPFVVGSRGAVGSRRRAQRASGSRVLRCRLPEAVSPTRAIRA